LRQVDPGNVVHASDSNGLVTITQIQPITVIYTLPEDSLASVTKRLREGAQLAVDAYDRDGKIKLASGALLSLDNQIDTTTGTVKLKAEFPNKEETLFPNQFVNVRMLLETRQNATVIPAAAVQRGSAGTFVYVVKDDQTVTVRPVKLGPVDGQNIAVESGVAPGETVVVDGADKLREGGKVELIRRDMPAAPAAGAPGQRGPRPDGAGKGDGKGKRGEGGQRGQAPTPQ
jgi:multidrug efflux system membrane fusion protein